MAGRKNTVIAVGVDVLKAFVLRLEVRQKGRGDCYGRSGEVLLQACAGF